MVRAVWLAAAPLHIWLAICLYIHMYLFILYPPANILRIYVYTLTTTLFLVSNSFFWVDTGRHLCLSPLGSLRAEGSSGTNGRRPLDHGGLQSSYGFILAGCTSITVYTSLCIYIYTHFVLQYIRWISLIKQVSLIIEYIIMNIDDNKCN